MASITRFRGIALVIVALLVSTAIALPGSADGNPYSQDPGPPFDSWNVTVTPDDDEPRELAIAFDSPVLGRRTTTTVLVPDRYTETDDPLPVAYFLHGTAGGTDSPARQVVILTGGGDGEQVAGGYEQMHRFDFLGVLDRMDFLVVAPDTDKQTLWCGTCLWIDGRGEGAIAAERHLYEEVIPLTQAMFRVRTDRGGRGIIGNSMGASGALIQGFRHPDRFAFIGAFSPAFDIFYHPAAQAFIAAVGYMRSQGYNTTATDEVFHRNVNPVDLAPQMIGAGTEIFVVIGDGCAPDASRGTCADAQPPQSLSGAGIERLGKTIGDPVSARLTELGLAFTYVQREGVHGGHNADSFRQFAIDRMNRVFAQPVETPRTFSFKTVDRAFSVWGYDVSVERPNNEFLNVLGARTDGSAFTLAGTGTATVRTPAGFAPGEPYRAVVTSDGAAPVESTLVADDAGRLTLSVLLGSTRTIDERLALVEQGQFLFPHTRVEIFEA